MNIEQRKERRDKIDSLLKGGLSFGEIGEKLGVSRQRIHQIVNPNNLVGLKSKNGITKILTESEKIVKAYLESRGFEVYKTVMYLPDFICIDRKGKVSFVEAKSSSWILSRSQKRIFKQMLISGYKIRVIKVKRGSTIPSIWGVTRVIRGEKYIVAMEDLTLKSFHIKN